MEIKDTLIIAHRGASADAPENTIAAFRLAVEQGANGIELDVHLTKDQQLAVIHNETVTKTTNGEGIVKEMTVKELKKLDAGSWFKKKFRGERIPLLEEVFQCLPPNFWVNIEIKNIPSFYEGIEAKVISTVKAYNRLDHVIISSFDHKCLVKVGKLEPRAKLGLLYSENLVEPSKYAASLPIPIYSLHPRYQTITTAEIINAKKSNLKVFPWTVNKEASMKRLIAAGVTGIITDYPGKLRRILGE